MGDTTTHGLPYPIGTDRVMDGDNAMQALAEAVDAAVWAGTGAPGPPGVWVNVAATTTICSATSTSAAPGTTVSWARYMKIGRTVFFKGYGSMAQALTDVAVLLPNVAAGTPTLRDLCTGSMVVVGTSPPSQSGVASMLSSLDRINPVTLTNAWVDAPAGHTVRWNVCYETAT